MRGYLKKINNYNVKASTKMMYVQCKCVKKSLFSICDFLERNIVSMSSSFIMFSSFFIQQITKLSITSKKKPSDPFTSVLSLLRND